MNSRLLLEKFDRAAASLQSPLLLVIRLYWGWSFAQTGWGKLTHLERTAGFFASLNLSLPKLSAIVAGCTECGGGILFALGLFARPVSVPLIFMMIIAYVTADSEALHAITNEPDKFTAAAPFLFLYAAVIILAFGPGRFALDAWLHKPSAPGR